MSLEFPHPSQTHGEFLRLYPIGEKTSSAFEEARLAKAYGYDAYSVSGTGEQRRYFAISFQNMDTVSQGWKMGSPIGYVDCGKDVVLLTGADDSHGVEGYHVSSSRSYIDARVFIANLPMRRACARGPKDSRLVNPDHHRHVSQTLHNYPRKRFSPPRNRIYLTDVALRHGSISIRFQLRL